MTPARDHWRSRLHSVTFEADTPAYGMIDLLAVATTWLVLIALRHCKHCGAAL